MSSVVVPLDGSELAESALGPGVALAKRLYAELVVVTTEWPGTAPRTQAGYLDARIAWLDHPARTLLVHDRAPDDAIVAAAADLGAIICMATRGRGAVRTTVLGSVAEAVVRSSPVPVVVVGPGCDAEWELPDVPLLLVGVDGSEPAREAALAAQDLVLALGGRADVVEVLEPRDTGDAGAARDAHLAALEQVAAGFAARGAPARTTLLDGFDPASMLVQDARERRASLLVLATHGRGGLSRLALGSVAMRVVRHAPCPVAIIGPAYARTEPA
jgi:nucleotide-binding universal stress UspA family protein